MRVTGLDLASLDEAGLDQLALLAAKKGMVFFASNDKVKQTYRDIPMKAKLDMSRRFGPLHKHAVQPRPKDSAEISVVYQDKTNTVRVGPDTLAFSCSDWLTCLETLVAQQTEPSHLAHRPDPRVSPSWAYLLLLHAARRSIWRRYSRMLLGRGIQPILTRDAAIPLQLTGYPLFRDTGRCCGPSRRCKSESSY